MNEPKTYAAQLAKRVRETLKESHPETKFKISGSSAWRGSRDRVSVAWSDGPSKEAVEKAAQRVVSRYQVQVRRSLSLQVLASHMDEGLRSGKKSWELVRGLEKTDLSGVEAGERACLLAKIVETHLVWQPPKGRSSLENVSELAKAWRTVKLAEGLKDESQAALEILYALAQERSDTLEWEQYVELASELSH